MKVSYHLTGSSLTNQPPLAIDRLFKPPQQQQQATAPQQAVQSPFDTAFGQNLFSSQSSPSFSFGGSSYSIPSFNSLSSAQAPQGSPFGSFGAPSMAPSQSFAPLSSASFLPQASPSFAPPSSYNTAFEPTNGRPMANSQPASTFSNMNSLQSNQPLLTQTSNSISSFASLPSFNQYDSAIPAAPQLSNSANQYPQHNQQQAPQPSNLQFRYSQQGPVSSALQQYSNSHPKT